MNIMSNILFLNHKRSDTPRKKKKNLSIHFDISLKTLKTTYTRHQKKKASLLTYFKCAKFKLTSMKLPKNSTHLGDLVRIDPFRLVSPMIWLEAIVIHWLDNFRLDVSSYPPLPPTCLTWLTEPFPYPTLAYTALAIINYLHCWS